MATVYKGTEDWLAHLPEVRDAVKQLAETVGASAEALLASHTKTGGMEIRVIRGDRTDYRVDLVDTGDGDGAIPFDLGWVDEAGQFHPGADIMRRAGEA